MTLESYPIVLQLDHSLRLPTRQIRRLERPRVLVVLGLALLMRGPALRAPLRLHGDGQIQLEANLEAARTRALSTMATDVTR